MPTHKSSDYKLSAVKYYLSHSKNQAQTCKIFGCSERSLMRWVDKYKSTNNITRKKRHHIKLQIYIYYSTNCLLTHFLKWCCQK